MKISEIITDKYKLCIPPTVYYDLLADVLEVEEEQEPFLNKPCVSSGVCEHDKNKVLDKITEIIEPLRHLSIDEMSDIEWQILQIIDKYKGESEE